VLLVETLVDRGDLDAAEEAAAAGMAGDVPDHFWYSPLLFARGRLRLAQGRVEEGVEDLLEHGRRCERDGILNPAGYGAWASEAAPALGRRDPARARALVEAELARARRWGTAGPIGRALVALGLVAGGDEGLAHLREAAALLEAAPTRLDRARAMTELGAALRRRNSRAEAREVLRAGLDLAHRCGAAGLGERAETELRATGARPRKRAVHGVDALTASERRTAEMAARGMTNRQIADALFVSVKTVETHLRHAFQKLGVGSRSELAAVVDGPGPARARRG
jgi:DNA-binding CsgD family transcriptional regulator